MKKLFLLITSVLIILCLFAGCKAEDEEPSVSAVVDPKVKCTINEDETPGFNFVYEYGNDSGCDTWLWCDCDIEDAALVAVNYDELTYRPSLGEVAYVFGDISKGDGVVLHMEMPEGFPLFAFSYSVDGENYAYAMAFNGYDGSTSLTFVSDSDILPMYESSQE